MTRLLIATGNRGKIAEFEQLVGPAVEVVSLAVLGLPSPDETGTTFEENAVLKAREATEASGLIAVADDSGIEVDALDGAPGVRSARFAGEQASDDENTALLLEKLDGVTERAARFVCVIAVATPGGDVRTFRGTLEGEVGVRPRGSGGFGYDPVMVLSDGRSVAELEADEKNRISHRGAALRNALPYIHSVLGVAT